MNEGGSFDYQGLLAVLDEGQGDSRALAQLAERLHVPLFRSSEQSSIAEAFLLTRRGGRLMLLDSQTSTKPGMSVEIEPRPGEQRSWPAPKTGDLARALGRKTQTVIDATTGWGQDSLHIFRMGYSVHCLERCPVMYELLHDAFERLCELDWVRRLAIPPPTLAFGNAVEILSGLENKPDCIYLDPMFPPKRKKSALAKKSMQVLQALIGGDEDKDALFAAAMSAAGRRVVVKSPDYAEPLGGKPSESIHGKLVRYDVYLTDRAS
ncbi:MAG: class I SAM-dependent methyltransferase [Gammaproteobacteria bacterium]